MLDVFMYTTANTYKNKYISPLARKTFKNLSTLLKSYNTEDLKMLQILENLNLIIDHKINKNYKGPRFVFFILYYIIYNSILDGRGRK